MCSSSTISTFLPLCKNHPFHQFPILSADENLFTDFRPRNPKNRNFTSISSSITKNNLHISWVSSDQPEVDDYNGWAFLEENVITPEKQKKGLPTYLLFGIGTSVVALLAVFGHYTLSSKGLVLRFSSPFHVFVDNKSLGSDDTLKVDEAVEPLKENVHEGGDVISEEVIGHLNWEEGKVGRVVVPVLADNTQQEALLWLKNLKIIEDEVKADEFCTRREYARWLVLVNSRLERNPRNRIVLSVALAGSTINAFDDIRGEDPDFEYIQGKLEVAVQGADIVHYRLQNGLGD